MVTRGSLAQAQADHRLSLIACTLEVAELAFADLVVEAIAEDLAAKQAVFATLGSVAKAGAILASNTSFLDLAALAQASGRPADVAGMHFFNPAQAMRLLELVRTGTTAPEVAATLLKLGKRLGKVAVMVGAGEGFVANRMLSRRSREALFMLEEGAEPAQVDRVLTDFGFPLGPFAVQDLGGLDVVLATRRARFAQLTMRERARRPARAVDRAGTPGPEERRGLVPLRCRAARGTGCGGHRAHRAPLRCAWHHAPHGRGRGDPRALPVCDDQRGRPAHRGRRGGAPARDRRHLAAWFRLPGLPRRADVLRRPARACHRARAAAALRRPGGR